MVVLKDLTPVRVVENAEVDATKMARADASLNMMKNNKFDSKGFCFCARGLSTGFCWGFTCVAC